LGVAGSSPVTKRKLSIVLCVFIIRKRKSYFFEKELNFVEMANDTPEDVLCRNMDVRAGEKEIAGGQYLDPTPAAVSKEITMRLTWVSTI
jgi:mRNA-degrading endonuclease toxin of MazEF toxin-antitoxin module